MFRVNWREVMTPVLALALGATGFVSTTQAQSFECDNRFGPCGTPEFSGGAGGGPCVVGGICQGAAGSILIANTDLGATYQNADDYDNDGMEDPYDNCVRFYNIDQADSDGDGIGDACDNCIAVANIDQFDLDGDMVGNACDEDIDGDLVLNERDNCELVPNPVRAGKAVQDDLHGDLVGDVCDDDIDGDLILNIEDTCPMLAGSGDREACFPDADGDGVSEADPLSPDLCPTVFDPDQLDLDGDLLGDACDVDIDGDDVLNQIDNCRELGNPSQADGDRDGRGDACDDRYCFVVFGDEANCLDASGAIDAHFPELLAETGMPVRLPLFVNRHDQELTYSWTILEAPPGSSAVVDNAAGDSDASINHEVVYAEPVTFTPDVAGRYRLRVVITTHGADNVTGEMNATDAQEMSFVASGTLTDAASCSAGATGGAPVGFALMLLTGLSIIRRKRA